MLNRNLNIVLGIIAVASIVIGVVTFEPPILQKFANAISIGILVSSIFYIIVVWLPDRARKNRIKRSLESHYRNFKKSLISEFLIYTDSQDYGDPESLLNKDEFKRYFKIRVNESQDRWAVYLTAIESNEYALRSLLVELEILRDELLFVLNNLEIHDENVFEFFKHFSQTIYMLKDTSGEYDETKRLSQVLWLMFTGYTFSTGYKEPDLIDQMIQSA